MAQIPRLPQQSLFEPQTTGAPTQGFETTKKLFSEVGAVAQNLGKEQIQAGKTIGSNQIQTSIRQLQSDATLKFPGDYQKQQQFVNGGAQSFLGTFIKGALPQNRAYFNAISKNMLGSANLQFAKNIAASNLKNQKQTFDNTYNDFLQNTVSAIRNGKSELTKENIAQFNVSLEHAEQGAILTPAEKENYKQKMLMTFNIAGAKTHLDAALQHGGVEGIDAKFREIISDTNNPLLSDPKTAASFTSQLRSYKNAVTSGLKASASANKDQIRAIVNNARKTGEADPQKTAQFDIDDQVANALAVHGRALEIFTSSPINKQNALNALDLSDPKNVSVQKTVQEFEADYKKNPMEFTLGQIAKSQFGKEFANADPAEQQQMRSAAVEIQRQRRDTQIKPATSAEMQPVIAAASSGKVDDFVNAYNGFVDKMGKFGQSGAIQLGNELKKNGIDPIVEEIGYGADRTGLVSQQILSASTQNLEELKVAAQTRLGITRGELNSKLTNISRDAINQDNIFSTSTNAKFISSLRNGAGNFQGVVLGSHQQNMERYMLSTLTLNQNGSLEFAAQQYNDYFANSFNYEKQRNSQYIRIPLQYQGRPLDQEKVKNVLSLVQNNLKMKDVDLSEVRQNQFTSQELANQMYWSKSGSYNSWVTAPDGDSYILTDSQGKTINSNKTLMPIRIRNSDIVSQVLFVGKQDAPKDTKGAKESARQALSVIATGLETAGTAL